MSLVKASTVLLHTLQGGSSLGPILLSGYAFKAFKLRSTPLYKLFYTLAMLSLCALSYWEPFGKVGLSLKTSLTLRIVRGVDLALLTLGFFDLGLQTLIHSNVWYTKGWIRLKALTILALVINWIVVLALPGASYYTRALRPLLVIERLRGLRKGCQYVLRGLPQLINMGLPLLIHHFLFATLAVVLFNGMDGVNCTRGRGVGVPELGCSAYLRAGPGQFRCKLFFTSLGEASIHLFTLTAGLSNFPMVMAPVVQCHPASALFFLAYLSIGAYLLGTLGVAVARAVANEHARVEAVQRWARVVGGCDVAFTEVTEGDTMAAYARAEVGARVAPRPAVTALFTTTKNKQKMVVDGAAAAAATAGVSSLGEDTVRAPAAKCVALFSLLRPGMPADLVHRFIRVVVAGLPPLEGESGEGATAPLTTTSPPISLPPDGLTRPQFRSLFTLFSTLEWREKGVEPPPLTWLPSNPWVFWGLAPPGLGSLVPSAPSNSVEATALGMEFLDGDDTVGVGEGEGGEEGEKGGGKVSLNPLAAAAAAAAAASESSTSPSTVVVAWGEVSPPPPSPSPSPFSPPAPTCLQTLASVLLVATEFPTLPPNASPWRKWAVGWVSSPWATALFDTTILVNAALEVYRMSTEVEGALTPVQSSLLLAQKGLLGVFGSELVLKLWVWGPLNFWGANWGHKLDLSVLCVSLGTAFGELAVGALPSGVSQLTQTLRSIRLMRYFQKLRDKVGARTGVALLPGLGPALGGAWDALPACARFGLLAAALGHACAIVGGEAFAGVLSPSTRSPVAASSYAASSLNVSPFTFNTYSAALTLVGVVAVKGGAWPLFMEGCVAGLGSVWPRGYFVGLQVAWGGVMFPLFCGLLCEVFGVGKVSREAEDREWETGGAGSGNGRGNGSGGGGGGGGGARVSGVEDWRSAILGSGVSFKGYILGRMRRGEEVWDRVFRGDILRAQA